MKSHYISLLFVSDVEDVGAKSLCYGSFCLSYILPFASFACNAVNEVGTLVGNVMLPCILDGCFSTFEGVSK